VSRRSRIDLRAEDGFTIVELLTAMVIGAIVLVAALTVLDTTLSLTTRVSTRVDTLQRGRNAMDLMIRDLRSQNCVNVLTSAATGATSMNDSLIGGSATSVDFYTDLGDGSTPPTHRTLTFSPTAKTIVETIVKPVLQAGAWNFTTGATTTSRTLLTDVIQDGVTPVFSFYAFDGSTPKTPTFGLPTPLSAADEARTVRISIAFKVQRTGGTTTSPGATSLQDDVYRRAADPNDADPSPECST
jgi:prepilin-type N-terminal cleavage/methylation domain-containing protein